jgi:Uma2 family endonuclease
MTAATPSPPLETLADLLHQLGDVPPSRILWRPYPGTATEDDVVRLADAADKRLCELVEGVLVEKAMGYRESALAVLLIRHLANFVVPLRLGTVTGADGLMRLLPGLVRIPDVSFTGRGRITAARRVAVADFAPDLAVEVLSASNTRREMERKRRDYLGNGTRLVWEFDPDARAVDVYTTPDTPDGRLTEADTLDGGAVLPGFTLSLRQLFAELDDALNP